MGTWCMYDLSQNLAMILPCLDAVPMQHTRWLCRRHPSHQPHLHLLLPLL